MRPSVVLLALLVAVPPQLEAQQVGAQVSLAQALEMAQRMSPTYRQALNDADAARWGVRNAYASALLPSLSVGGSLSYTGSGSATFGGSVFNQSSPSLSSGYGVQLNWELSGSSLSAPAQQRASNRAIGEDINTAQQSLRFDVTNQYLTTLQAVAQTEVARQQVTRNAEFLALAEARFQVGQATILDVKQAQVQKGQADVALLRANQTQSEAKLELFRRMGVNAPADLGTIALSDSFPVASPTWELGQLTSLALEENPAIRSARARETSAGAALRSQRSRYLPSLSFSANWNGFTQEFTNTNVLLGRALVNAQGVASNCDFQNSLIRSLPGGGIGGVSGAGVIPDCKAFADLDATGDALTADKRAELIGQNNVFPFSFTNQPFGARVQISLPIFDRFDRNLAVAQSRAQRDDLREALRARELQTRSDVQARYLAVQTAFQAIAVQAASRDAARDQLQLAQDRYRLGSGSALDVTDAQNNVQRAEGDYVNAVYDYHKAIAALELAVGRPLR
ncbi:MAG: TolC family protein [Gemmatimonadales bacterium]